MTLSGDPTGAGGVDSHAHLDSAQFRDDLPAVLGRAKAAGIDRIVNVFLGPEAFDAGKSLFDAHPQVSFVLGVHPHDAAGFGEATVSRLRERFARDSRTKALGEIGLDFYRDWSPIEDQRRAFGMQLDLALELDLPVVVHSRSAETETLAVLDERGFSGRPVMWHCFGGGPDLAEAILSRGFMLSLPGPLTYPKNEALREAARLVPLDKLVLETDCPYLSPVPHRGKRCEPAFVAVTAAKLAEIRGETTATVLAATGANAARFFSLD